eukprot:TRINITY_DN4459_c0_g1_i1.p1 TRINITY_DN4459_c0_g1~~TRINITY_DN4459_c0_g1_i1.p1  ORF type:complete len:273 (+),score=32.01 TRINITY_DN4459_c0_g1_i1:8-826(+)
MDQIPEEVLIEIFHYLTNEEILSIVPVCKSWKYFCDSLSLTKLKRYEGHILDLLSGVSYPLLVLNLSRDNERFRMAFNTSGIKYSNNALFAQCSYGFHSNITTNMPITSYPTKKRYFEFILTHVAQPTRLYVGLVRRMELYLDCMCDKHSKSAYQNDTIIGWGPMEFFGSFHHQHEFKDNLRIGFLINFETLKIHVYLDQKEATCINFPMFEGEPWKEFYPCVELHGRDSVTFCPTGIDILDEYPDTQVETHQEMNYYESDGDEDMGLDLFG